ncbi:MFS transporter [Bacillus atrophaeus]|uniref:YwoG n=1 Tax=Bacillus atrophaeus (strain 1942) TaxID=720555 RepID=A0ABM5M1V3_BACA1|nr:MFS transporter [Bacillus atrophaeus]AMR61172.1 MFS transporter [Bacillus subtilis subsp. globigii]ADP34147.1 YwoG [Bacillus atrophaeus 1942]AIK46165.1 sugar (and other) transporter family protein [Bacillus atrophaeus subsp. globigii]AKL86641.1 YwoG [Bacillus atrophaeus UCMB-5137]ARW08592.1 putative MFS-type transporter YwoG [Bacillus atrophaeus]
MKKAEPIWTKDFIMVVLVNLFVFVFFYTFLAVLPIYMIQELGGTESQGGLLISLFLLSAIITRPFSGPIIERFGKKRMAVIALAVFALSSFLYMPIHDFYLLLALRFFQGIWFSILTTVTGAIAADIIPMKRRGEGLGYFAMSMNLAMAIGPFLGLSLVKVISFPVFFTIFAVFISLGFFVTLLIKIPKGTETGTTVFRFSFSDMFEKGALKIAIVGLFISFCYSSVTSFLSVYAKSIDLLNISGYFFVCFAVTMMLARPFTGKLFDRVGPGIVIYPSILIFSVGLCLLSFTNSGWMLLLSGAVIGLGYGSIVPCMQTLAIQNSPAHRSGFATATFFTFFDTGIAAGSYVFGLFVASAGFHAIYLSAGLFVLVSLVLYTWSRRKPLSLEAEGNVSIAD